ncbi:DUF2071 domain-containing protein [Streptosporangium sp. NPDC002607]
MAFNGTPRPLPRWHHARTELDDFAIVSYRVPTGALARLLPEGFAPAEFTFEDGGNGALVSAVAFRDRDFHFRFLPPVAIGCGQKRVRRGGRQRVDEVVDGGEADRHAVLPEPGRRRDGERRTIDTRRRPGSGCVPGVRGGDGRRPRVVSG